MCAILVCCQNSLAAIRRVDASAATNGPGNAQNWSNAYNNLQSALSAAQDGDTIAIAQGTYKPHASSPTVSFVINKRIFVTGGYAGLANPSNPDAWNPSQYVTILSGDLSGNDTFSINNGALSFGNYSDNSNIVVYFQNPAQGDHLSEMNCILKGVTIQSAKESGIFFNFDTAPLVHTCVVRRNWAQTSGAGVFAYDGTNPTFRNCLITNNRSEFYGGGLYSVNSIRCLDTTFDFNEALDGGGAYFTSNFSMKLICCTLKNNVSFNTSTAGGGGGLTILGGDATLVNCLVYGNRAAVGGGLLGRPGALLITNCTIADNTATYDGGGLVATGGTEVRNSVIWGNAASVHAQLNISSSPVTYSDVQGGYIGTGNINSDPLFVASDNYRLSCNSPCLNVGSDIAVPPDSEDVNENSNHTEDTPDLDLKQRKYSTVDMGAYERGDELPCAADTNHDGSVNVTDLLAVINQWGNCPSPPITCSADIAPLSGCLHGNGVVNVSDLLAVINAWGAVPLYCSSSTGALNDGSGMPQTISDCFNIYCAGLEGEDWQNCITKCTQAVCETNPAECQ